MDPVTVVGVLTLASMAAVGSAVVRREKGVRLEGLDEIEAAARADLEGSVGTAAGLAGRLERLDDLADRGRAILDGHASEATSDLAGPLADVPALREEAGRKAAEAVRSSRILGRARARPEPSRQVMRARRVVHDADVAVRRLEDLADRVADRARLLDGGRGRVARMIEEHEARYAAILAASETESLRLTRPAHPGASTPLGTAVERLRALRVQVDAPHPSLRDLEAGLAGLADAMSALERDVERARWVRE
jgi:hypothetical protein